MVSDPCYTDPTWCQKKLTGVLPGRYVTGVLKSDEGDWGERIGALVVIHEDYLNDELTWRTDKSADIGVDSGQCGIFSMESYRNDSIVDTIPQASKSRYPMFDYPALQDGDKWYEKMCRFTLSEDSWGVYENGVVSSSGYGDGSYRLLLTKHNGKIVGIGVDFLGYKNYAFNHIIKTEVV